MVILSEDSARQAICVIMMGPMDFGSELYTAAITTNKSSIGNNNVGIISLAFLMLCFSGHNTYTMPLPSVATENRLLGYAEKRFNNSALPWRYSMNPWAPLTYFEDS